MVAKIFSKYIRNSLPMRPFLIKFGMHVQLYKLYKILNCFLPAAIPFKTNWWLMPSLGSKDGAKAVDLSYKACYKINLKKSQPRMDIFFSPTGEIMGRLFVALLPAVFSTFCAMLRPIRHPRHDACVPSSQK